ncbi:MAG: hypothetical protein KKB31_02050 [Nanoarchaeota archaeon]|nr:hypothetical protein [Nanoarchaeota archaeon]
MMDFKRRDNTRYSKLGKRRKKKQKWRRPTGRDNKMREKRRGYPAIVSVGYKKPKEKGKVIVNNIRELENIKKDLVVIIGGVGKKKRIEIAKKAKEMKLSISNMNTNAFLKKIEKEKTKKKKEEKSDNKKTKDVKKTEEKNNEEKK